MKCSSPNALISLILPHYELFIEFERWQHIEDAEVKPEREEENEAPNVLPEPLKKKRRTKKFDITSMERIDSFMSNTYLDRKSVV